MPGVGMLVSTDWVKTGSVLTIIMWTMPCSVGSLRVRAKYSSKWLIGPTADSQDGASPGASGVVDGAKLDDVVSREQLRLGGVAHRELLVGVGDPLWGVEGLDLVHGELVECAAKAPHLHRRVVGDVAAPVLQLVGGEEALPGQPARLHVDGRLVK